VDDEGNVCSAAAKAFDGLQEHLGARAIDQTIPTLLEALWQAGEGSGTHERSRKLCVPRAYTYLNFNGNDSLQCPRACIAVAGNALSKRLTQVLGA